MTPLSSTGFVILGVLQLSVLFASALVPFQLDWNVQLRTLPRLLRQLFWVYGGYVVLSIVSLGTICIAASADLAEGSVLARVFCLYGAVFWGVRLLLQAVMDARPYLTNGWLRCGYHLLTLVFITLTVMYVAGAAASAH